MRSLPVLAVVGACGFTGAGRPQSIDAALVQVDAAPPIVDPDAAPADAPPDGVPTIGDGDGDGVLDVADNCPNAVNPTQHDEDLDLAGDACDPCPTIANEAATNTDGDALVDACDPRPMTPGDEVEATWYFDVPGTGFPDGWKGVPADPENVTTSLDRLQITAGTSTQILAYNIGRVNIALEVGLVVDTYDPTDDAMAYLLDDVQANANEFFECGFKLDDSRRELVAYDVNATPRYTPIATSLVAPATAGQLYRIRMLSSATQQICGQSRPGLGPIILSGLVGRQGNFHIGFRVQRASVSIRHLVVYRY